MDVEWTSVVATSAGKHTAAAIIDISGRQPLIAKFHWEAGARALILPESDPSLGVVPNCTVLYLPF